MVSRHMGSFAKSLTVPTPIPLAILLAAKVFRKDICQWITGGNDLVWSIESQFYPLINDSAEEIKFQKHRQPFLPVGGC